VLLVEEVDVEEKALLLGLGEAQKPKHSVAGWESVALRMGSISWGDRGGRSWGQGA
jgi:hypothetical protein